MANLFANEEEFKAYFVNNWTLVVEDTQSFTLAYRGTPTVPVKRKLHQFMYGDKEDWLRYRLLTEGIELR